MQDWLNRIGLTLQFVALFLVTPEILGERKVEALAELWRKPLAWLSVHITRPRIVGLATALMFGAVVYG
jgi:hypothetical protein